MKFLIGIWIFFPVFIYAQSSPLIMEHADQLSVSQGGNRFLLKGHVRFKHDSLIFLTQQAEWDKPTETIRCTGNFRFIHPAGHMRADRGEYRKKKETALAEGHVELVDSSARNILTGGRLRYNRKEHYSLLNLQPVFQSLPNLIDTISNKKANRDTLTLSAKVLHYNDSTRIAEAWGNTHLTHGKLEVHCDSGIYDQTKEKLWLNGSPKVQFGSYELTGDQIFLILKNQKVREMHVIGNAHGILDESEKKDERMTDVKGDSLRVFFLRDTIRFLAVRGNSEGKLWKKNKPERVDQMSGSNLDIQFDQGLLQKAIVAEKAKTWYNLLNAEDRLEGQNQAVGDSIFITFKDHRPKRLDIVGNLAEGAFLGASKKSAKKSKAGLKKKSKKIKKRIKN